MRVARRSPPKAWARAEAICSAAPLGGAARGRRAAREGAVVAVIGVGCMGRNHGYGPSANKQTGINLIRAASISK